MPVNDTSTSTVLQSYLSRLDNALGGLPERDRREILLETQSHVAEQARRSPMLSVSEILEELGEPEAYAGTFVVDHEPRGVVRLGALRGIALLTGSWRALPVLLFVLCCYSVAIIALLIAVAELTEPAATGLYVTQTASGRAYRFIVSDPLLAANGEDVLGWWLVPLGLAIALIIHLAMSALLRRVVTRQAEPREIGLWRAPRGG